MPIYEYSCAKCGHELEALQKMSDAPLRKCPACGRQGLQKLVSAASFRLKGGGWYETDFKTGDKKQLADSDSSGGASGNADDKSSSSEKTDSKPAETSTGSKDGSNTSATAKAAAKSNTKKPGNSANSAKPTSNPGKKTGKRPDAK